MNSPMPVLYSQENSDATHRHLFDMVYKFNFQLFTTTACIIPLHIHLWFYFKSEETLNLFFLSLSEKL